MIKDKENTKVIETLEKIKEQDDRNNLVLTGDTGVGKTYLAKHIFKDAYFISDNEFKVNINSWNLRLRKPEERNCDWKLYPLECLRRKWVVIFDDYWVSNESEAYFNLMMNWIDYRLMKWFKTIWTTNLNSKQLEERDKRIFSRMQENSIIIQIWWDDRRKINQRIYKL